jgi:hypothetical protein
MEEQPMSMVPEEIPEEIPQPEDIDLTTRSEDPPSIKPSDKARLIVIEAVHHQEPDGASTTADNRFRRILKEDGQPYMRRGKIGCDWLPLDTGWVEHPSMIVLRNEEGTRYLVQPTKEEREATERRIIEVGIDMMQGERTKDVETITIVPPGESCRFTPVCKLWLRCQSEQAKYTVYAFPE